MWLYSLNKETYIVKEKIMFNYHKYLIKITKYKKKESIDTLTNNHLLSIFLVHLESIKEEKFNEHMHEIVEYLIDNKELTKENLFYHYHQSLIMIDIYSVVTDITLWHLSKLSPIFKDMLGSIIKYKYLPVEQAVTEYMLEF